MEFKRKIPSSSKSELIIIGDPGVGKTNILSQFVDRKFKKNVKSTIGNDYKYKTIESDGRCRLLIWDMAGDHKFRPLNTLIYRSTMGIMLVFDVTQRSSYMNLHNWLCNAKTMSNKNIPILLIGNKCDLEKSRAVSFKEAKLFADQNHLTYIEISAKSGRNIDDAFIEMTQSIKLKALIDKSMTAEYDINDMSRRIWLTTSAVQY